MAHETALKRHIEGLIRSRGRIPFSEYMDAVLYHPFHGYYSREASPIGPRGDFYTSADLDPAMGQLMARLFREMAAAIDGFQLVEVGAGTGLLARHVLEAEPFKYSIIERSQAMRGRQQENLAGFDVEWIDRLPEGLTGCVFSNEFFDALPVRRFVRREGRLREIFVALGPDGPAEVEGVPEVPLELPFLREGYRADVSLEARRWMRRIGSELRCGYHLTIDYGYERREFFEQSEGTLMCYRRHRPDADPYSDIGEKDITAHVNFSDLVEEGVQVGLEPAGLRTQMEFLVDLGVLELMEPLAGRQDAGSIRRLQALKTLLLPPTMGERFKVLLQRKGLADRPLIGFGRGFRRRADP